MVERLCVRIFVATALSLAAAAFFFVQIPVNVAGDVRLPAIAFEQPELYRLEVALFVFYGALLLVTPAFSGLFRARLPIEISARGARFADDADPSAELTDAAIKELREASTHLKIGLATARAEIALLKGVFDDNKQPAVTSKR
jgi:hypothetical protein